MNLLSRPGLALDDPLLDHPVTNPLLDFWQLWNTEEDYELAKQKGFPPPRDVAAAEWSLAVPYGRLVRRIAELAPICEAFCCLGYWTRLLRLIQCETICADPHTLAFADRLRTVVVAADPVPWVHGLAKSFTLLLVYPPADKAVAVVNAFKGRRVVVVWPLRSPDAPQAIDFWNTLDERWNQTETWPVPCWPHIPDACTIWERKPHAG